MKPAQVLLWATSLVYVAFGLGFALAPEQAAEFVTGTAPTEPSAMIDMRATYGGMAIGIGLFIAICARRPSWVRAGLMASLLTVGGLGVARVLGIVLDGSPNTMMYVQLAAEVVFTPLYVLALRRLGPADDR